MEGEKYNTSGSTYKHKSGAQKRKNKQQQLQLVQSLKKVDAFLTPSDSLMAGSTTSQASPTSDKPDSQDDDCGAFSKPSLTEFCDSIVEVCTHSTHEKPSNKIPRLDNDVNSPMLSQFECDDPDHLDIVMNSAIQQEKLSDSSEDATPPVNDFFKKTSLVSEEMFLAFHPHQPTNVPFNTGVTYSRKDTQGTKVRRIWVTCNEEKICLMFAPERCRQGPLIDGCSDWKHITTRLAEHEKSHCHHNSSEAYFVTKKGKSIYQPPIKLRQEGRCPRETCCSWLHYQRYISYSISDSAISK